MRVMPVIVPVNMPVIILTHFTLLSSNFQVADKQTKVTEAASPVAQAVQLTEPAGA